MSRLSNGAGIAMFNFFEGAGGIMASMRTR